jgi:hypothetical protein
LYKLALAVRNCILAIYPSVGVLSLFCSECTQVGNNYRKPMKFDITSSAVEKGIDLAKEFLGKLISPGVEETNLMCKKLTIMPN